MQFRKLRTVMSGKMFAGFAVALVATVAVLGGTGMLTPGTGVSATSPTRASFVEATDIKIKVGDGKQQVMHVPNAAQTVMHKITIKSAIDNGGIPGSTGWHSHPGPVVVLIESGEMTFYDDDCSMRRYTAGQAFIDSGQGHAHVARNEGNVDLVLAATYFDVPVNGAFRLDVDPAPAVCF